jgi:hypothetical protein
MGCINVEVSPRLIFTIPLIFPCETRTTRSGSVRTAIRTAIWFSPSRFLLVLCHLSSAPFFSLCSPLLQAYCNLPFGLRHLGHPLADMSAEKYELDAPGFENIFLETGQTKATEQGVPPADDRYHFSQSDLDRVQRRLKQRHVQMFVYLPPYSYTIAFIYHSFVDYAGSLCVTVAFYIVYQRMSEPSSHVDCGDDRDRFVPWLRISATRCRSSWRVARVCLGRNGGIFVRTDLLCMCLWGFLTAPAAAAGHCVVSAK